LSRVLLLVSIILTYQSNVLFGQTFKSLLLPQPQDSGIVSIISAVKESTIASYITELQHFGTRYWNNPNRDSVFSWVQQRFSNTGIADVVTDSFQYSGSWQKNIIATIHGTLHPEAEIIVGAHSDSYSSDLLRAPGADDNASGTAAALEMARVLTSINYQPSVTIRFVGFAAEEAGLRGSADYARKARLQNRNIRIMFNYDMIGHRNQSSNDRDYYIVWYPGNEVFSNVLAAVSTTYTTLTPILTTQFRSSSDSWSFYQQGYNSVFAIERDFNPYYHSPSDSLSKLDIPYTCEIIKSGLAALLLLDEVPAAPTELSAVSIPNGILLAWKKNTSPDIGGYNIYRREILEHDFTRINSSLCEDTTWVDSLLPQGNYFYRVSAVDVLSLESQLSDSIEASPVVGIGISSSMPNTIRLEQNYPNPFNPVTTILFALDKSSFVSLKVYDVFGIEVAALINEKVDEGFHRVTWNAEGKPSGTYFCQLRTPEFVTTRKLLYIQ
jgi:hypothetical protein